MEAEKSNDPMICCPQAGDPKSWWYESQQEGKRWDERPQLNSGRVDSKVKFLFPLPLFYLSPQWIEHPPTFGEDRLLSRICQFSLWVMSDSATPWTAHTRYPCSSPSPRAYSNSCPSSQWCHPTISSSVVPFSSCLQSFPESGSFPMSQFFASGGQGIGVSASASASASNEYSGLIYFRMDWLDLLSVQGTLKSLLQHHSSKASILQCSTFFIVQLSHPYMTTGKTIALTRWTFVGKVLFFNMLSRLVIAFLPRSKRLSLSWLQSPSVVILESKKIKSVTVSAVSPSIWHKVMGLDAIIFVFWMLSFKPTFHSPLSLLSRGSSVSLHFLP